MSQPVEKIEEEESKSEVLPSLGSFEIANLIKTSQTQNGLKHGDYKRYHHYCSQRLKRIRKSMKFSHGAKYQMKKREDEVCVKDPLMLHSLLFHSERLWAYGMNLKQSVANQAKGKENRRAKFVIRKKFKKAVFWANLLEKNCHNRTEKKTSLEAETYSEYIKAIYSFEVEKWEEALNSFIKSRQICSQLIKISDAIQSIVYQERIDQIDQAIRYCNYKLNKGGKLMSLEEILELKNKTQDPSLNLRLEALLEENRQKSLESKGGMEIEFNGEKLPIKNDTVSVLLQKIDEIGVNSKKLDQNFSILDNFVVEQKLGYYIEIFSCFDEAIKLMTKEKDESKDSEAKQKILIKIITYLNIKKFEHYIERNSLQLALARARFSQEKGLLSLLSMAQSRKTQKVKTVTPFEIVRWCDNLLQVYKQIMEIEKGNCDAKKFKQYEVLEGFYQNMRCFYVSCIYFSQKKFIESLSLLAYCEKNLEILSPDLKSFNLSQQVQENKEIHDNIKELRVRNLANNKDFQIKEDKSMMKGIDNLNIEGKTPINVSLETLLKKHEQKPQFFGEEEVNNMPIIDLPAKIETLGCKPIFFDLGFSMLKYGNLANIEKKIKEDKPGFFKSAINRFNIFRK